MINVNMKKVQAKYMKFVQSINPELKNAVSSYLDRIDANIALDSFTKTDHKTILEAVSELQDKFTSLMQDGTDISLQSAKDYKQASFAPYLTEVKQELTKLELPISLAEDTQLNLVFGGGMDSKIIDSVWDKVWPDSLTVDDRITKWGKAFLNNTESIIKTGITEGKSAANIAKDLRTHIEDVEIERKAGLRLAAYTTNSVYQTAQAEISIAAKFVMGTLIERDDDGSDNCMICADHAGDVGGPGIEYTKEDFGGRDSDMYIMTNGPAYHPNCMCTVSDVFESAEEFVDKAREEYEKDKSDDD